MAAINFETNLYKIGDWLILRLPESASAKLPSRGQVVVQGTINGHDIKTPLEPDGKGSHWFKPGNNLLKELKINSGDTVKMSVEATKDWPEVDVPADLMKAVKAEPTVYELWQKITPMARWEWVRWTRSTGNDETRKHRIEVAVSKLSKGMRRPCCWNRNLCSEPAVSKSGVLRAE